MRAQSLGFNAAAHSRLAAELEERRAAGLFASDTNVPSSSHVRMEQRLLREEEHAKEKRGGSTSDGAGTSTDNQQERGGAEDGLTRLLHLLGGYEYGQDGDSSSDTDGDPSSLPSAQAKVIDRERSASHPKPSIHREVVRHPRRLAWLQVTVTSVELDDHARFTLADRVRAQLRTLVAAYALHQRQRDWELPLRRIDAFVAHALDPAASSSLTESAAGISTSQWAREARKDAERALQSLHGLQQLHTQALAKWDELRVLEANEIDHGAAEGGEGMSFISRFALVVRKRATSINLSGV